MIGGKEMSNNKKEHLGLNFVGSYSLGAKYVCPICHHKLWCEISQRTHGQEWLMTRDDKHHFKNRCNITPIPVDCFCHNCNDIKEENEEGWELHKRADGFYYCASCGEDM